MTAAAFPKAEWAKEEDFDELLSVANTVFGGEGNADYFQLYHPKLYVARNSAAEHLVVRENGAIKGALGVFPAEMEVCGTSLKADGFGTMGVLKEARGRGAMKALMRAAVEASRARSDLAFLGGRRQRYEYFGFTPSGVSLRFSFNRDNGRHSTAGADNTAITFAELQEGDAEALRLIQRLQERNAAYIRRSEGLLCATLHSCRCVPLLVRNGGKPCGYVVSSGEHGVINEAELDDAALYPLVLSAYLRVFELKAVAVNCVFPFQREKLRALEAVCENFVLTSSESFMIHDYAKVLDAFFRLRATYAPLCDGSAVFDIEGDGKIAVEVKGGRHSVRRVAAPAAAFPTDTAPYPTDTSSTEAFPADIAASPANTAAHLSDKPVTLHLTPIEATRLFFGAPAYMALYPALPPGLAADFPLPLFYTLPDFV